MKKSFKSHLLEAFIKTALAREEKVVRKIIFLKSGQN